MDFEIYKRKLLEEDERNRLSELQTKYNGIKTPDYANMSLRDELQTRFDLDELNNLQQKYGVQQTSALKSQITASSPQSSYVQPISSQQPNSQPSTWDNTLRKAEQLTTAALDGLSLGWADELEGAASAVGYGLASLNPQWNKTNESFWDAMKRGYVKGRDNRRQVLAQGLQENPTTTTVIDRGQTISCFKLIIYIQNFRFQLYKFIPVIILHIFAFKAFTSSHSQ